MCYLLKWCLLVSTMSANVGYPIELTHQDSVALNLINNEHSESATHLYDLIEDLQISKEMLERENEVLLESKHTRTRIIWAGLVLILLMVSGFVFIYTRKKQDNSRVTKYKKLATRAQQTLAEREKFLAYTNHEIRTPLNAVSGSAELLAKTKLSSDQEKYVNTIKASVDNVLILVNDILDLSRIESGKIDFQLSDFLLSDVLSGIKYILQEKTDKKGLEFITHLDSQIPPVLRGDSRYLNQILINLCNNALKFTDIGKVELKATLDGMDGNKLIIRFDVTDTGKGIRKSKLATIFNQFEQETRHTIKHTGGSGLGLAITKQLVEAQGGSVSIDSKYLEGTTFTVKLGYEKGVKRTETADLDFSILEGLRMLIVDDNELNREILKELISSCNRNVFIKTATSGQACLTLLENEVFDFIFLDIQMPEMDGYETARKIRQEFSGNTAQIPIIAMTAYAMDDVARKCFEAGMNDYLTKPVDSRTLITKISRFVQKRTVEAHGISLEHIDLGNLKRLTRGDNSRMFKYIDMFLKNVPADIRKIHQALENNEIEAALELLHRIKGNTVYMGNSEVARMYDRLMAGEHSGNEKPTIEKAVRIAEKCVRELNTIRKNYKLLFLELK